MHGHPRLLVPSPPRLGVVRPPWTSPETSAALLRSLRLHCSPCVPPKALPRYQLVFRDNSGTQARHALDGVATDGLDGADPFRVYLRMTPGEPLLLGGDDR